MCKSLSSYSIVIITVFSASLYSKCNGEIFSKSRKTFSRSVFSDVSVKYTFQAALSSILKSTSYQRFSTLITSDNGVSLKAITFFFHNEERWASVFRMIVQCSLSLLYTSFSPGCNGYFLSEGRARLTWPSSRQTVISLFSG